jgi:hypothetical protein
LSFGRIGQGERRRQGMEALLRQRRFAREAPAVSSQLVNRAVPGEP